MPATNRVDGPAGKCRQGAPLTIYPHFSDTTEPFGFAQGKPSGSHIQLLMYCLFLRVFVISATLQLSVYYTTTPKSLLIKAVIRPLLILKELTAFRGAGSVIASHFRALPRRTRDLHPLENYTCRLAVYTVYLNFSSFSTAYKPFGSNVTKPHRERL